MDNKEGEYMTKNVNPDAGQILVCISGSLSSSKLISAAKKMADDLNVKWYAVYVEEPNVLNLHEAGRNRAVDHLRLAEQLGAETFILDGRSIAEEIINLARQKNITKIVAGKPRRSLWKSIFLKSPLDQLVRMSGEIDVCIITGGREEQTETTYVVRPKKIPLSDYITGIVFLILANGLCFTMYPYFHQSNLVMVYLLGVMLTAANCGQGPAILISCLSALSFDFFFTPPRFSLTMDNAQDIVTFIVMLLVALVISRLASGMRQQANVAHLQERQATAMHGLSRQLLSTRGVMNILNIAVQYISEVFNGRVMVMLPDENGKLHTAAGDMASVFEKDVIKEMGIAQAAFNEGKTAGPGTDINPATEIIYTPLQAVDATLGLIALRPGDPERSMNKEQLLLLESLAKQIALALEVERLTGDGKSL